MELATSSNSVNENRYMLETVLTPNEKMLHKKIREDIKKDAKRALKVSILREKIAKLLYSKNIHDDSNNIFNYIALKAVAHYFGIELDFNALSLGCSHELSRLISEKSFVTYEQNPMTKDEYNKMVDEYRKFAHTLYNNVIWDLQIFGLTVCSFGKDLEYLNYREDFLDIVKRKILFKYMFSYNPLHVAMVESGISNFEERKIDFRSDFVDSEQASLVEYENLAMGKAKVHTLEPPMSSNKMVNFRKIS